LVLGPRIACISLHTHHSCLPTIVHVPKIFFDERHYEHVVTCTVNDDTQTARVASYSRGVLGTFAFGRDLRYNLLMIALRDLIPDTMESVYAYKLAFRCIRRFLKQRVRIEDAEWLQVIHVFVPVEFSRIHEVQTILNGTCAIRINDEMMIVVKKNTGHRVPKSASIGTVGAALPSPGHEPV
jgi:hypothetical protein